MIYLLLMKKKEITIEDNLQDLIKRADMSPMQGKYILIHQCILVLEVRYSISAL